MNRQMGFDINEGVHQKFEIGDNLSLKKKDIKYFIYLFIYRRSQTKLKNTKSKIIKDSPNCSQKF